ncbi:bifunctional lysylphosphatidylglycerol flippase/synthetase MprF [Celeribacter baekdonensis]|uniref:bifunctional lysylphosphatidylglycerol flippase/synthetase MprF n=1 Tax=Celeribacter baekdonensis TaxID=875171 RepID=UPI003A8F16D9
MHRLSDKTRALLRRSVPLILGLVLFGLGIAALSHLLHSVHPKDVIAQARSIPLSTLLLAVLSTFVGYGALTGYDWWALRFVDRRLPLRAVAMGSFLGSAFGNTVGVSIVSGGAVRYRIYAALGLDAFEVATVSTYIAVSVGMGLTFIGLGALALHPGVIGGTILSPDVIRWGATALLIVTLAILMTLSIGRKTLKIRRFEITMPPPAAILGQLGFSLIDVLAAALCLWLLLPEGRPDFTTFTAIFAGAMMLGVISHVPGGIGVFETAIIAALPNEAPVGHIAAALLLFRAIYYLLPFALAFLIVSLNELRIAGGALSKLFSDPRADLRPAYNALSGIVPSLVAVTAFGYGVFLLAVAFVPSFQTGALNEGDLSAALLLEIGVLGTAVMGVVLLILSHALLRRVSAAYWMMILTMGLGIVAAVFNNFDFESMDILAVGLLAMLPFRRAFYRQAKLTDGVFTPAWIVLVLASLLGIAAFFFFLHRATPYSLSLWTEFSANANTPRSLRAGVAASTLLLVFTVIQALRPAHTHKADADRDGSIIRTNAVLATSSDPQGCLALSGDKRLMFSDQNHAYLMYGVQRSAWVALGDPVGPETEAHDLAWAFFEQAQRANGRPVFYEVSETYLPLWIEMGLSLHKIGEEAVVVLKDFSLSGSKFKTMRAAYNKKQREGLVLEMLSPPHSDAVFTEIEAISTAWLSGKTGREKGFSVGRFDRAYLDHFPLAVIRREGRIVAFANVLAPGDGTRVAIDLMRYLPAEASGMMEFLFLSLIEHMREAGAEEFSLGVAPLSGLSPRPTARMWNSLGRMMFEHGGAFYNFEGLRSFKQKFRPDWRPRYIAVPPGYAPMRAMANVALLISGGPRGLIGK